VAVINFKLYSSLSILGILLLSSCEEQVAMGDKLTSAERDYIRSREFAKCVSQSDDTFEEFENSSNEKMVAFETGKTWKLVYSKDNTEIETSYIYVWKVDGNNVYLRYMVTEEGVLKNKFIKIDTSSNIDMLRNIQEKYCNKFFDGFSYSASTMTVTITDDSRVFESTDNYVENSYEYKFSANDPVFFSALNRLKTKKTFKTTSDTIATKTEKYNYAVTALSTVTEQPLAYDDSTITNRYYCGIEYTNPVSPDTRNDYAFPYTFKCSSTSANQDTTTLDITGDGTADFDPASEL
jgi:hypothetical protein